MSSVNWQWSIQQKINNQKKNKEKLKISLKKIREQLSNVRQDKMTKPFKG